MKLKYLFPLFIATLVLATSCKEEESVTLLDEVQVSSSFVTLPLDGGNTTITVTAKNSWEIEKVTTEKDKVEWLEVSSTKGSAGESQVSFSAPASLDGRTAQLLLKSGGKTQLIKVMQGLPQITNAKVAEAKNVPDGKTVRITGVCTSIINTLYGNWFITDETGELYIYGTLDKKGNEKNFLSLGLEVGDEITIEGPKSSYKGNPQLVNVTVIKINKSLIKVDSVENAVLPIEGGEFIAHLSLKGEGISVDIPEDAKSWLSISSIESTGKSAVVKFKAATNTGGDRKTTLKFHTTDGSKKYSTETMLAQKGAIVETTIAEFLNAEPGDTQYRLSGIITKIENTKYGNLYLRDFSGEVYVYGIKDFQDKGLKEGDIITLVGKRAEYKGSPQVASAYLEKMTSVIPATIAEVLTKEDSKDVYYMVTGEVSEIKNPGYGNHNLKDGDAEIYVYGCYPGYGATDDFRKGLFEEKGIKVGDKLTVIATKSTYKGEVQLANGIYFSHESK